MHGYHTFHVLQDLHVYDVMHVTRNDPSALQDPLADMENHWTALLFSFSSSFSFTRRSNLLHHMVLRERPQPLEVRGEAQEARLRSCPDHSLDTPTLDN